MAITLEASSICSEITAVVAVADAAAHPASSPRAWHPSAGDIRRCRSAPLLPTPPPLRNYSHTDFRREI